MLRALRTPAFIVVIAVVFHFVPWFDGIESAFAYGIGGIGYGLRSAVISVGSTIASVGKAEALSKENTALKQTIADLEAKGAESDLIREENASLRGLVALGKRQDIELVAAHAIGADPDTSSHALIIDRGTEFGVQAGDAVVSGEGTFVGKVLRASAGRSTVLLAVDPRSKVAAMVSSHPEANGVASGDRGLVISLTLVPQNAEMHEGDMLVTSGLEQSIPRGLVIGKIESVRRNPSDPFMSATIAPAIEQIDLTTVAVLKRKKAQ